MGAPEGPGVLPCGVVRRRGDARSSRRLPVSQARSGPTGSVATLHLRSVVVRRFPSEPTFLRIRWETGNGDGAGMTLTAILCLRHRQEIALAYPTARGCGGSAGDSCDLCEGRTPADGEGALPS